MNGAGLHSLCIACSHGVRHHVRTTARRVAQRCNASFDDGWPRRTFVRQDRTSVRNERTVFRRRHPVTRRQPTTVRPPLPRDRRTLTSARPWRPAIRSCLTDIAFRLTASRCRFTRERRGRTGHPAHVTRTRGSLTLVRRSRRNERVALHGASARADLFPFRRHRRTMSVDARVPGSDRAPLGPDV